MVYGNKIHDSTGRNQLNPPFRIFHRQKGNFSTNQFLYKPIIPQTNDKEKVGKEEIVMKNI